jgi:uncharacterized protein (TIGR00255 family)
MLKSMTGYGRSEQAVSGKTFLVEIRSLNGKQFETLVKIPQLLKPYEFEIRNMLSEMLVRGSIECVIVLKQNGAAKPVTINIELAKAYYEQLRQLSESLGLENASLMESLLKLPEVVSPSTDAFSPAEWQEFRKVLQDAIREIDHHRRNEGEALEKDLRLRVRNIRDLQNEVIELEPARKEKIRDNIRKLLEENLGPDKYDKNRMEQELLYYIEKIDITEEQVRLSNHCDYFMSLLDEPGDSKGKKLSFVLQEIGREINTTGSKANDARIQKLVVMMKDELEKAKEQVLNVL